MASYTPKVKELLRSHGCCFERPGRGDHEIWFSPITQRRFPVDQKIPLSAHRECGAEAGRYHEANLTWCDAGIRLCSPNGVVSETWGLALAIPQAAATSRIWPSAVLTAGGGHATKVRNVMPSTG